MYERFELSLHYLMSQQRSDGSFDYLYQTKLKTVNNRGREKNGVRMAAAAVGICDSVAATRADELQKRAKGSCRRAIQHLNKKYNQNWGQENLGVLAMTGMAYVSYLKHYPQDKRVRSMVWALRSELLSFFDSGKGFFYTHRWKITKREKLFFPGEALVFLSVLRKYLISQRQKVSSKRRECIIAECIWVVVIYFLCAGWQKRT